MTLPFPSDVHDDGTRRATENGEKLTLTGEQVRAACDLLRWGRFDLQRRSALPFTVIDRALASQDGVGDTLPDEIILKDAFHRAGIEFTDGGGVRLQKGEV